MAIWKVHLKDNSVLDVEAHRAEVSAAGSLYFTDNGEDCSKKIIAPGLWKMVDCIKASKNGF